MKAVVCSRYGILRPFKLEEIDKPVPREDEVLVEIHASSVTYSNTIMISRIHRLKRND